jgi:hypothetical protein
MGKGEEVGLVNGLGLSAARRIARQARPLTLPIFQTNNLTLTY